ncbi:Chemotaxis protein methyltransferase [subsurface metagenome]
MENTSEKSNANALELLLDKVYRDGGYDFRDYKRGTLMRRLEGRLHATGTQSYRDYTQFLDTHPEEYKRLAYYLTILVSGFFRSHYTFEQVARLVLPELVSHKIDQGKRSLRFWSAACARGEEPYSIAIMLAEFLGDRLGDFDTRIYATDINRQALKEAQAGVYPLKDIENLPHGNLENYFTRGDKSYVVRAYIREMVCFAYFDLTSAIKPPFLDVDCIFCCNILIYLQKQLQERLLGTLYEALATPGYLILGEVETPTDNLRERLKCLDSKARIYQKNGGGDNA